MEEVVLAPISPSLEKKKLAFICKSIQKNKHQEEIKSDLIEEFSIVTSTHTETVPSRHGYSNADSSQCFSYPLQFTPFNELIFQ